jgi:hypothetical protein
MNGDGQMDRAEGRRVDWKWLPVAMPGVARLMANKRRELGDAHVNLCWKRGVLDLEPGWFFAREGALSVGAPFPGPEAAAFGATQVTATQALLLLRPVEGAADGAH